MKLHLTSYDNATVGTGGVVNDCLFVYNDFSQLIAEHQSHSGLVNTSTTPKIQYGFTDGSANTIRATSMTYPNGRVLTYAYGTADGIDDANSRVKSLIDYSGTTHLADYSYLGQATFVETDYTEPEIKYTLVGTAGGDDPETGDIYRGLDRFGRVTDSYWYNYGDNTDTSRIKYGYDQVGNRIWRRNLVATAESAEFDELYAYDQVHRLQHMDRGLLNSAQTGIDSINFVQCWTLDETGNWGGFRENDNGSWNLVQNRESSPANEITSITGSSGPSWITPAYSPVGNMTTIPKPTDPTADFTATYDAWNRLTQLVKSSESEVVSEYQYDAAKRRVIQKSYTNGILSETRHLYYTDPSRWQVIEERLNSTTFAGQQCVWGPRYLDDLVLRDIDTNSNATLFMRHYSHQDANWNVVAIANSEGTVQERYEYTSYGTPVFLDASFGSRNTSMYQWQILFAGYYWDSVSGHYIVRNRIYNSALGTWLQKEFIQLTFNDDLNLFRYLKSSPLSSTDPSGNGPFTLITSCAGFFGHYGEFCGPFATAPCNGQVPDFAIKKPLDRLDVACAEHDCCLATPLQFINPFIQCLCNIPLCAAARDINSCNGSPDKARCNLYRLCILASPFCLTGYLLP